MAIVKIGMKLILQENLANSYHEVKVDGEHMAMIHQNGINWVHPYQTYFAMKVILAAWTHACEQDNGEDFEIEVEI